MEYDEIARSLKRSYLREDLLIDIATGQVGAFVRYENRTGLNSLAFDERSIDHRRAIVRLAKLTFRDEFRTLGRTRDAFREALGEEGTPTPKVIAAAIAFGLVRSHGKASRTTPYSIRDLIMLMQARPMVDSVYLTTALLRGRIHDPREMIVEKAPFPGIPELTAIGGKWTRK